MSYTPIENLRKEFSAILKLYNDISVKKTEMYNKISGIKEIYNNLVKTHSTRTFLFCLDSLFFQYKILNLELEHYNKKISLLQNRMYGDYYKLNLIMVSQIKDSGIVLISNDTDTTQEFPIYKDIDPFYKYKLEDIIGIHDRMLNLLRELYGIYEEKMANIKQHRDSIAVGASLLIFINAMEHENVALMGHIQIFSQYLEFYHQSQARYLDNLYRNMVDFYVNLEDSVLINLDGNQGEAIAEPCIESYEDGKINIHDIYRVDDNQTDKNNVLQLDEDREPNLINNEETVGPFINLQMLGSQLCDENNKSSTGTIIYMETNDSREPNDSTKSVEVDYIPQNITMEIDVDVNLERESE